MCRICERWATDPVLVELAIVVSRMQAIIIYIEGEYKRVWRNRAERYWRENDLNMI